MDMSANLQIICVVSFFLLFCTFYATATICGRKDAKDRVKNFERALMERRTVEFVRGAAKARGSTECFQKISYDAVEPCCFCAYRAECALPMRVRLGVKPIHNTKCDHFKPQTILSNCYVKCPEYEPEDDYYCRIYKDRPQCFCCKKVVKCKNPMAHLFISEMEKRHRESTEEPTGKLLLQKMEYGGHLFIFYESEMYELVRREDEFQLVKVKVLPWNKTT